MSKRLTTQKQTSKLKRFAYNQGGKQHTIIVAASGSKGNAVMFDNVLIDVGVPYKRIQKLLRYVDYIFISHRHMDHINLATLETINKQWPEIKVFTNSDVLDFIAEKGSKAKAELFPVAGLRYKKFGVTKLWRTFELSHSVPNNGFECMSITDEGVKSFHLHMTDTKKVPTTSVKYDTAVVEVNYFADWYEQNKQKLIDNGQAYKINNHTNEHLSDLVAYPFIYNVTHGASLVLEAHQSGENRPRNRNMVITREMIETRINAVRER